MTIKRNGCARWALALLAAIMTAALMTVSATAAQETGGQVDAQTAAVSPALHLLAARDEMAVATLCGNEYYFSADVFARALNVDARELGYITVTSLPTAADGELMIGSTRVSEGQVISASNLSLMSYVAADDSIEGQGSFTFAPSGAAYEMTCRVHLLKELNYSPTLSVASEASLAVSTHRDFVAYGTLSAHDPEGDDLTFEVVSRPAHGLVLLTDAACGEYVYLPRLGYTGEDSFRYVARDMYGNYSAAATVKVEVSEPSVSVSYDDMTGRRDYNAALTMAELGIMQGKETEAGCFFLPEQTVSRLDFLTMAMKTIGVDSVPSVSDTGFYDDAAIPNESKGYVATAYSLGYIKGSTDESGNLCFSPDATITRAEAAVILRRMVDADSAELTPAFADASDIPAWAGEAIATLSSLGVMMPRGGTIAPNDTVTRGGCAMMLTALYRVVHH